MARAKLSLAEQETIILYDNELDTANVYTHDKRMLNKLKDLSKKHPEMIFPEGKPGRTCASYTVPKRCVTIRPPYSEERRKQQIQDAAEHGTAFQTGATDHNKRRRISDED